MTDPNNKMHFDAEASDLGLPVDARRRSTGSAAKIIVSESAPTSTRTSRRASIYSISDSPNPIVADINVPIEAMLSPNVYRVPSVLTSARAGVGPPAGRNRSSSVCFEAFQAHAINAFERSNSDFKGAGDDVESTGDGYESSDSAPQTACEHQRYLTALAMIQAQAASVAQSYDSGDDGGGVLKEQEPESRSRRGFAALSDRRMTVMAQQGPSIRRDSSRKGPRVKGVSTVLEAHQPISRDSRQESVIHASVEDDMTASAGAQPRDVNEEEEEEEREAEDAARRRPSQPTVNNTASGARNRPTSITPGAQGGATPGKYRARAVSIDVVAQYMVDTTEAHVLLQWQDGVIMPHSLLVVFTLYFLQFLVGYNAVVVPFELCFFTADESSGTLLAFDVTFDMLFLVSIAILLRTGLYLDGTLVTSRSALRSLYIRQNLVTDAISMLPTAVDIAFIGMGGFHLSRPIRLFRALRFTRILTRRRHDKTERGILSLVATTCFIAHLLTCAFVAFSTLSDDTTEDAWKMTEEVAVGPMWHRFLAAVTHVLDIISGFRETVPPQTDLEYLYTVVAFIAGTFLFAYVVGCTGDWVSRNTARMENLDLRLTIMDMFIDTHKLPRALGDDILEFYRYTWESMRGFDAASVLKTLPVCIGVDVSSFMYRQHLSQVEFFERMPAAVQSELAKRMGMMVRAPGEKIMVEGQIPFGICFVNHGVVDVMTKKWTVRQTLRAGEMFGDELLRSDAAVPYSYVAQTFCQLFVLSASDVTTVLEAFPVEAAFMSKMIRGKHRGMMGRQSMFQEGPRGRYQLPLFSYRSRGAHLLYTATDIVALYNAFLVILRIGFTVDGVFLSTCLALDALADLIWIAIIIAHFHMQLSSNGELIRSRRVIMRAYLRGAFTLDLITILPIHLIDVANPFLRIPRLTALTRYFAVKDTITIRSTFGKLLRSLISFALITHLVSCAYFGLSKLNGFGPSDGSPSFKPPHSMRTSSLFVQYSTSVLFSLKILTGRGNKPNGLAMLSSELILCSVATMFGLFGVAYLIGAISVLVAHFNPLRFIHQLDVDNIDKFMRYKQFPLSLQRRVRSYLDYRWECTKGVGLKEAIADLPRALRLRVLEHITLALIRQVPIFADLSEGLIQGILECFEYMCVPAHEYVYRKSEMGNNMYIVLEGEVAVSHSGRENVYMGAGSFFGEEAILNKNGLRVTTVKTHTGCVLVTITADALETVLSSYSEDDQQAIIEELATEMRHHVPEQSQIDDVIKLMLAESFYMLTSDSPVSPNLHTGREVFLFISTRLPCDEPRAIAIAELLLSAGKLRAMGMSSPTVARKPDHGHRIEPNTLYRLIDFSPRTSISVRGSIPAVTHSPLQAGAASSTASPSPTAAAVAAAAAAPTSTSETTTTASTTAASAGVADVTAATPAPGKGHIKKTSSLSKSQTLLLKRTPTMGNVFGVIKAASGASSPNNASDTFILKDDDGKQGDSKADQAPAATGAAPDGSAVVRDTTEPVVGKDASRTFTKSKTLLLKRGPSGSQEDSVTKGDSMTKN